MINTFKIVAKAALFDPHTTLTGAMVAQHPTKKRWEYFFGGTPAHDIVNGDVVKWDKLAERDFLHVFISQQHAEMVQSGEDADGNQIDLRFEIDQLWMDTKGW